MTWLCCCTDELVYIVEMFIMLYSSRQQVNMDGKDGFEFALMENPTAQKTPKPNLSIPYFRY